MDPEKQLPMVLQIQEIEREIIPVCWMFNRETYYAINSKLMGVRQPGASVLLKDCYWVE